MSAYVSLRPRANASNLERFESTRMRIAGLLRAVGLMVVLTAAPLLAGTVAYDGSQSRRMAVIDQQAPRLSWATSGRLGAAYNTTGLFLIPGRGFLFHFDVDDLPPGQRIVRADLILPLSAISGPDPRFFLWRMIAEWGVGVSWDERLQRPAKQPWAVPGGRAPGLDRALNPSAVVRETQAGPVTVNVTEDVALWYAKASPNQGWMLSVEDPGIWCAFRAPFWDAPALWTLQITYEPEVGQ